MNIELNQQAIAVTDSGAGGLSVLRELLSLMPQERFVYLADEAWMPYGDKPLRDITSRTLQIARYFRQAQAKALVIACNTATAAGADEVRALYPDWPVVGIEPAVKPAAMMTRSGKVGILATTNTLASERFRRLVSRFESVAEVYSQPCPGLVELIEYEPFNEQAIKRLLQGGVQSLIAEGVDVLVLGCTHYPFVAPWIQDLAGPEVQVIDTGLPVARHLRARLSDMDLLQKPMEQTLDLTEPRVCLLSTGDVGRFKTQVQQLLGPQWAEYPVRALELPA